MRSTIRWFTLVAATACPAVQALAAEGGAGFYLLGTKGPAAAIMPPPGVFFQNDIYLYSGELGGGSQLPTGGKIAVGVEGKAAIELPTVIWVLPEEVMGGHLGLSATIPIGWKETSADLTLTGPLGGVLSGSTTDAVFTVGDPIVSGFIGWEAGNFHYQVGTLINVPIGDYQEGEISNVASTTGGRTSLLRRHGSTRTSVSTYRGRLA